MKTKLALITSLIFGLGLLTAAHAQPQGPPGPRFNGAISKLFGDNPDFSADIDIHMNRSTGDEITMPGKMAHSADKFRMDMDMSNVKGLHMPPQAAAQMKQMGMDSMTTITRVDQKTTYIIYPSMKAYVANTIPDSDAKASSDYKVETTKVGNETLDGHDCVKNNVVMTGSDGVAHKATVWNASDLKQFPVKIEMSTENGDTMVMHFASIKLDKPDSSLFEPPTDYTKYDNMMSMMMSRYRH
jgi:hypothetical protein